MLRNSIGFLLLGFLLISCSSKSFDYNELSSFDENGNLRAIIEIPVGTNDKIEYNPQKNTFEVDTIEGQPRVIEFLPYPINYGFIPSTTSGKNRLVGADPLDILVLGATLKTGQAVTVKPIALLKMIDDGEEDHKILSIPLDTNSQIVDIASFEDLSQNHPEIRDMIANWFLYHDKNADIQILGWFDEAKALEEVLLQQIYKQ